MDGTRPRKSGSAKLTRPSPPKVVPSRLKSACSGYRAQLAVAKAHPSARLEAHDSDFRQKRFGHRFLLLALVARWMWRQFYRVKSAPLEEN